MFGQCSRDTTQQSHPNVHGTSPLGACFGGLLSTGHQHLQWKPQVPGTSCCQHKAGNLGTSVGRPSEGGTSIGGASEGGASEVGSPPLILGWFVCDPHSLSLRTLCSCSSCLSSPNRDRPCRVDSLWLVLGSGRLGRCPFKQW